MSSYMLDDEHVLSRLNVSCLFSLYGAFRRAGIGVMSCDLSQRVAILSPFGRQAGVGLVYHGFDGGQFHPHGADAGHRVVAMGERHDRAELMAVNRWSLNRMLQ